MKELTKEAILNFPKTININGCWIPKLKPRQDGYVVINYQGKQMSLHRISMCIFNDIDYNNKKIDTRHSDICVRACFNFEHLKPGSSSDNAQDLAKTKTHCKRCGLRYKKGIIRSGIRRGKFYFYCSLCSNDSRRKNNG